MLDWDGTCLYGGLTRHSFNTFEISGPVEITSDRNWDIYERVSGRGCPGGLAPGLGLGGLGGGLSAGGERDGGGKTF